MYTTKDRPKAVRRLSLMTEVSGSGSLVAAATPGYEAP